jgi:hypothetical protein
VSMSAYEIERPTDGEYSSDSVDITLGGELVYYAVPGQTGACWNIGEYIAGEREKPALHVCDLDSMADVLRALRASDAHVEHVRRWEGAEAAARLRETRC